MTLVTEAEIRESVSEIERSNANAVRKARLLVSLAKTVRNDAKRVAHGANILAADFMDEEASRLFATKNRMMDLNDEITSRARAILEAESDQRRKVASYLS